MSIFVRVLYGKVIIGCMCKKAPTHTYLPLPFFLASLPPFLLYPFPLLTYFNSVHVILETSKPSIFSVDQQPTLLEELRLHFISKV